MRQHPSFPYVLQLLSIPVAEVLASFAVWHGTPTDWPDQPLHFWAFEIWRLQYWCSFTLLFAGLWLFVWMGLRRHSATLILVVWGAVCALGLEVLTSFYFWKSLSSTRYIEFLGWFDFRQYFLQHLVSWGAVVSILGLWLWYLQNKKTRASIR